MEQLAWGSRLVFSCKKRSLFHAYFRASHASATWGVVTNLKSRTVPKTKHHPTFTAWYSHLVSLEPWVALAGSVFETFKINSQLSRPSLASASPLFWPSWRVMLYVPHNARVPSCLSRGMCNLLPGGVIGCSGNFGFFRPSKCFRMWLLLSSGLRF